MLQIPNYPDRKGFCFGVYEVTYTSDGRLYLCRDLQNELRDNEVTEFLAVVDPSDKRISLCPRVFFDIYLTAVDAYLKEYREATYAEDIRKYGYSARAIKLDKQMRIRLRKHCVQALRLSETTSLIIRGACYWYELLIDGEPVKHSADQKVLTSPVVIHTT